MTRGRDWDESEHPRWPDGAPGGKGGEFRDAGGGDWAERLSGMLPGTPAPKRTELEREREKLDNLQARLRAAREKRKRGVGKGAKPSGIRGAAESKLEAQILEQRKVVTRLQIADDMQRMNPPKADEPDIPKLTPAAAKFLTTYVTNSRLNAGERVPIQLTKNGLVRVRTGKNGIGLTERWLELTPEGRRVKLALEMAPSPAPKKAPAKKATPPAKKAPAPKLRKSLLPGDQVEWTDEQDDNKVIRGTVRRQGRFTMVDWEGGRSEKVSARGTDPSIRKVADAPKDYVQPEETPPVKVAKKAAPKKAATVRPKVRPVTEWTDEELDAMLLKKRPGTAVYEKLLREHERRAGMESPRDYTDDYVRTLPTMAQRAAARAAKEEDRLDRPRAYDIRSNARHFVGKRIKFTSRSFGGRPGTEYEGELIEAGYAAPAGGDVFTTIRLKGIQGSIWVDDRAEVRVVDGSGPPVVIKPPKPEKAPDAWLAQVDGQLAGKAPAAEIAASDDGLPGERAKIRTVPVAPLVRGRDLRGELDYREIWGEGPGNFMEGPDYVLGRIWAAQGFDGPPQVVSEREMDRAIASGWTEMFRRVEGPQYAEQLRTGAAYPGLGGYGNGTYAVPAWGRTHIAGYGSDEIRLALRPDAKIADMWELDQEWRDHYGMSDAYRVQDGDYERAVMGDLGRWAAARGFDAIFVPDRDNPDRLPVEWIILNRTAVMVQEAGNG